MQGVSKLCPEKGVSVPEVAERRVKMTVSPAVGEKKIKKITLKRKTKMFSNLLLCRV